jgi:EmrB/QacA subfamily drug resistance transporter
VAIGINGAMVGLSTAVGPIVGGLLTEKLDWSWIFFLNLPVVVLALVAARLFIDESRDTSADQRLDMPGLLTAGAGLFGLTFGLVEANRDGWTSPTILAMFAVAAVGLLTFVAVEARQRRPMLPLHLFRRGMFSGANAIALLLSFAMFGLFFFVSLYLQNVLAYSPIEAGAAFLPMTVIIMLVAPVAGAVVERGGTRPLMVAGMLLMSLSLGLFAQLDAHSSFWDVFVPMALGGVAMALALTPLVDLALASVPADMAGVGAGVLNSARQVGGALGLAVMGAIVSSGVASSVALGTTRQQAFVSGFHSAVLCSAAVALCGAVAALWMRGSATGPAPVPTAVPDVINPTLATQEN